MSQDVNQSIFKKWLVVTLAVTVIGAMAALPLWNFIFKPSGPSVDKVECERQTIAAGRRGSRRWPNVSDCQPRSLDAARDAAAAVSANAIELI